MSSFSITVRTNASPPSASNASRKSLGVATVLPESVTVGLMSTPASAVRHLPTASKFSNANPRGSIRKWQLEQHRVAAMLLHALAKRCRLCAWRVFLERRNVRRRRRGRGAKQVVQHPLTPKDDRGAI